MELSTFSTIGIGFVDEGFSVCYELSSKTKPIPAIQHFRPPLCKLSNVLKRELRKWFLQLSQA